VELYLYLPYMPSCHGQVQLNLTLSIARHNLNLYVFSARQGICAYRNISFTFALLWSVGFGFVSNFSTGTDGASTVLCLFVLHTTHSEICLYLIEILTVLRNRYLVTGRFTIDHARLLL